METDGGGSVFRERKRTAVRTAVVMAVAAATMVLCAALYMRSVTGTLREETLSGLREVARQSAGNIAMRIEKDMQMLEAVSRFVGAQPELDIDGVTRVLCEEVESTSFKRMGLITPDGTAHTTDSVEMDLGGRGYFLRAMDGETVISKELTDYADGEPIYVYATPILRGGRAEAVLFATNAADAFASVINVRMFEGAGYSYLTNAGGDVLVYPDNPESEQGMSNIFDRMEEGRMLPDEELGRMRRRMSSGDSGVEEYFLHADRGQRLVCAFGGVRPRGRQEVRLPHHAHPRGVRRHGHGAHRAVRIHPLHAEQPPAGARADRLHRPGHRRVQLERVHPRGQGGCRRRGGICDGLL